MSYSLTRTLRHGIQLASRKGFMTFTSVLVLSIATTVVVASLMVQALFASAVGAVQKRVDMNIFMLPGTTTETVTGLSDALKQLPEVKSIVITSADEALADFKLRHKDDFLTLQALQKLESNPLGAIISIQASDTAAYEVIARYVSPDNTALSSDYLGSIEKINYFENKSIIEKLARLQSGIHSAMVAAIIIAIVLSALMVGSIVRSVAYALKEEIVLLKALGSTSVFLHGQFLVAYAFYAVLATIISLALGYLASVWIDVRLQTFAPGVSLTQFFTGNILQIAGVVCMTALLIGWISSIVSISLSLNNKGKFLS